MDAINGLKFRPILAVWPITNTIFCLHLKILMQFMKSMRPKALLLLMIYEYSREVVKILKRPLWELIKSAVILKTVHSVPGRIRETQAWTGPYRQQTQLKTTPG